MLLVPLHIHFTSSRWQWHNMEKHYYKAEPHSQPFKGWWFLVQPLCRCSELLYIDGFTIKCVGTFNYFFPILSYICTGLLQNTGEKEGRVTNKTLLTSGIDWIDSTKLSSNDSQIASFTATHRWQSRLWEVHILSSNCNFKSANRLLQDMSMLTDISSKLQFVLYNHYSCVSGQMWAGHWHSSAHRTSFTLSAAFFSKWLV